MNVTKLVVRNARKDEDHLLYQMFCDAVEKGEGCSVNEFPSLNVMRLDMLATGYTALIEEEQTNKLIGFLLFNEAAMSRSGKGKVCDGTIIVSADARGKGFGSALNSICQFLIGVLCYERLLKDTFFNNSPAIKLLKQNGVSVCGVLPKSAFQKGVGWVDLLLSVEECDKKPSNLLEANTRSRI